MKNKAHPSQMVTAKWWVVPVDRGKVGWDGGHGGVHGKIVRNPTFVALLS